MTETPLLDMQRDMALLARYLLDTDHTAEEIVYAIEKPRKYLNEMLALHSHLEAGQPWELVVEQVQKDFSDEPPIACPECNSVNHSDCVTP